MRWPVLLTALAAVLLGCNPPVVGAACRTDDGCPTLQFCTDACTCAATGTDAGHATECTSLTLRHTFDPPDRGYFGWQVVMSADGTRVGISAPDAGGGMFPEGRVDLYRRSDERGAAWDHVGNAASTDTHLGLSLQGNADLSTLSATTDSRGRMIYVDWAAGRATTSTLGQNDSVYAQGLARDEATPLVAWLTSREVGLWRAHDDHPAGTVKWTCGDGLWGRGLGFSPGGGLLALSCQGEGSVAPVRSTCPGTGNVCAYEVGASQKFWGHFLTFLGDHSTLVAREPEGGLDFFPLDPWPSGVGDLSASRSVRLPADAWPVVFDQALRRIVLTRPWTGQSSRVEVYEPVNGVFVRQGRLFPPDPAAARTFGDTLAISDDGRFVVVGAPEADRAYVYGE